MYIVQNIHTVGCSTSAAGMQVKRALKGKAEWQRVWGHTMYHPEDVPYRTEDMSDLPDTFTPARHKVSLWPSCCVSLLTGEC